MPTTDHPPSREKWQSIAERAAGQHGAFSRSQAQEVGLNARRLRAEVSRGLLRRPLSDVFAFANAPITFRQRCVVASLAGAVISHESAAALHNFDGFADRSGAAIHVCFPRDHKRKLAGYQVHTWSHTDNRDVAVVDGIRCTSIARTLVQLGLRQQREVVEVALDSALRGGASLTWIEETHDRLRRSGPTGHQVLDEILTDPARASVLPESLFESIVERVISNANLPLPVRQFVVEVESGTRRFDLAFPDARLGIEAHSRLVHFGPANEEADNLRDFELAAAGWEVLYITWGMAQQPELFLRLLEQTYQRRKKLLGSAAAG